MRASVRSTVGLFPGALFTVSLFSVALFSVALMAAGCTTTLSGTALGVSGSRTSADTNWSSSAVPRSSGPAAPGSSTDSSAASGSSTVPASIPPTDLDGEVYGFIRGVNLPAAQITLDKIDWFTGAAAEQACAKDGIQNASDNWCTGYYYRNENPALRLVAVGPQATIVTLTNRSSPITSDLATVAQRIDSAGKGNTYRLVVAAGVISELQEMFRP